MRRVFTALAALSIAASVLPVAAEAQTSQRQRERGGQQQQASGEDAAPSRAPRIAPLRRRANAGPCPYVKILYDAARYVELTGDRVTMANVGFTGEIEGLAARRPVAVLLRVDRLEPGRLDLWRPGAGRPSNWAAGQPQHHRGAPGGHHRRRRRHAYSPPRAGQRRGSFPQPNPKPACNSSPSAAPPPK